MLLSWDTYLELTVNNKNAMLINKLESSSECWYERVAAMRFPSKVSRGFRAFGKLFFLQLLMWLRIWSSKESIFSLGQNQWQLYWTRKQNDPFCFTTGCYVDYCKSCIRSCNTQKSTKGKSPMVWLPRKASIVYIILRTLHFLKSQCRLFILFYPLLLF